MTLNKGRVILMILICTVLAVVLWFLYYKTGVLIVGSKYGFMLAAIVGGVAWMIPLFALLAIRFRTVGNYVSWSFDKGEKISNWLYKETK